MEKKNVFIVLSVLAVVVAAIVYLKFNSKRSYTRVIGQCEVVVEEMKMPDELMAGLIERDQTIFLEKGYYACNSPVPGDAAYYRYAETRDPVVKRVVAVEGDKFKVVKDAAAGRWNLEVNGELVKGRDGVYFFGGQPPPTLSLYEKPRDGVLKKGEVILFSYVPPGREDSGFFGLASTSDLLARVSTKKP